MIRTLDARRAAMVLAALSAVTCSDARDAPTGADIEPGVAAVIIAPDTVAVAPGERVQLTAAALDTAGQIVRGRAIRWTSSDPAIATIDASGRVTGLRRGAVTITAAAAGKSQTAVVLVTPNDAQFVSQGVPTELAPGERRQVAITMRNTGTTTWTAADEYKLGSQNPQDNDRWGTGRVYLEPGDAVDPGQSKSFFFDITAPDAPGTYDFQWRMVQDGVEWFGAFTPNVEITVQVPAQANDARFEGQFVPTVFRPGETRTVAMTIRNAGTTTWTRPGEYKLGSQNPQDNVRWGTNRIYLEPGDAIAPGQAKSFAFEVTAPLTPGTYDFQWRMVQDGVEWFGALSDNVRVTVEAATRPNDAEVAGVEVPTLLQPGETRRASITMRNTGTATWTRAREYKLGSQSPQDNMRWGTNRIYLEPGDAVAPGQTKTFAFDFTAPLVPGTYHFQWRMVQDGVEWFGALTSNIPIHVQGPARVNDATFVSQDVPRQLAAGEARRVSVTMRNTGSATWTRAGLYRLGSQNPQDNGTWGIGRVELGADAVAPGQSTTFSFDIVAPVAPRVYDFQWRMVQENVEWFGAFTDNVPITVSGGGGGGGNCAAADPNDTAPDDAALQACLDRGGRVELLAGTPGYIIASGVKITVDGTVLTSAVAPAKATLLAHPGLFAPLVEAQSRANFTIEHLIVDGNKGNRTRLSDCAGYRPFGVNIIIGGSRDFVVRNSELRHAMCGTALGLNGSSFEIAHNLVADNGFTRDQQPRIPEPWSDGITAGLCDHGWIHHNTLANNTDVALLSGGGRGCRFVDNTITQSGVRAFAGLAVHNFAAEGKGDQTDAVYQRNTITSSLNGLDFGISIGIHPWFPADETQYGLISDNTASGAVVNLAVDGYAFGTVRNNTLSNAQGNFSHNVNCPNFRANYTVAHARSADLQPGGVSKFFHPGVVCGSASTGDPPPRSAWEDDAFDALAPGPLHGRNGWAADPGAASARVQRSTGGGNVLRVGPLPGSTVAMGKDVPDQSGGRHRFELDVMIAGAGANASLAKLEVRTTDAGWDKKLQLYFGSSVRLNYSRTGAAATLVAAPAAGRWYRVRLELNFDAGLVDAYVDDELVAAGLPVSPGPLTDLALWSWQVPRGAVYLDNLRGVAVP